MADSYDVVVVGGGAAGLSAAIVLGRCRRNVFVCDVGQPRNQASRAVHCLLGHEGTPPRDLLGRAKFELERYPTVKLHADRVTNITPSRDQFSVVCAEGSTLNARKVLLTTGLTETYRDLKVSNGSMVGAFTTVRIAMDLNIGISPSQSTAWAIRLPVWRS
jgi:thioredoxin reductase